MASSSGSSAPLLPHGRTARRLEWQHLPPGVRAAIERRLGSTVTGASSRPAGYTPGFASVLDCEDGSRHFVKAASLKAQRGIARAYREEARKLRLLPPETPAPRLQWVDEFEHWVALETAYVDAVLPERPWREDQLATASQTLVTAADTLTPAPGIGLTTAAEEFAEWPAYWERVQEAYTGVDQAPWAQELATAALEVLGGDTLCHTDVRDDNLLVRPDGSMLLCDWNWPVLGPDWFDSLTLLIGPRGDGHDVEGVIAEHPLLAAVPREDIDGVLALLAGYFLKCSADPGPPSSPYLRDVQLWQGETTWEWLAERRGW
ncbi:hypothetical protein KUV85_02890 [Nocardioides panacisoli]|uniref:phosphotransferase family protein n=1 Tax=Nocardioides panacisoli TaxID=627624 RepID=UPI001C6271AF|nr:hypothetical protein [Nocardioides panacisoli]QYJ04642.1 hypothetical protein KUV85_02890 [Nocardioides panacisoli]